MLPQIWRKYYDYLIVFGVFLLIVLVGLTALIYLNLSTPKPPQPRVMSNTYAPGQPLLSAPSSQYPPFAKTQRAFGTLYNQDDIQYELYEQAVNLSHDDALGTDTFVVQLYNSRNAVVTPTDDYLKAISVGCEAQDGPYRKLDIPTPTLSFAPYETKKITVNTDAECVYLGTADGVWFWKIY